jgi:uncharacterized protein YciI
MKSFVLMLGFLFVFALAAIAQQKTPEGAAVKGKPAYDAELAKRLGGNKSGMKSYVLAILKTGPNDSKVAGPERSEVFKGHMANIQRLAGEGKLAVAGPFDKNESGFRGIFILNTAKLDEARAWVDTDPVVKSGIMIVDLYPWFGTAALMAPPEIHEKITAPNP